MLILAFYQVRASEKEQLALNFEMEMALTFQDDQFQLHNDGKTSVSLWGSRLDGQHAIIEQEPRIITPGRFYFIPAEANEKEIAGKMGANDKTFIPLDFFLANELGDKYVAKFLLLASTTNGKLQIYTQMIGLVKQDWQQAKNQQ